MNETFYWIYILNCANNTYYTGYTINLARRYQEHLIGTNKCKYTRSFKPLSIAQCWRLSENKAMAMRIEKFIKKLSKKEKSQFILYPEYLVKQFEADILLTCFSEQQIKLITAQ